MASQDAYYAGQLGLGTFTALVGVATLFVAVLTYRRAGKLAAAEKRPYLDVRMRRDEVVVGYTIGTTREEHGRDMVRARYRLSIDNLSSSPVKIEDVQLMEKTPFRFRFLSRGRLTLKAINDGVYLGNATTKIPTSQETALHTKLVQLTADYLDKVKDLGTTDVTITVGWQYVPGPLAANARKAVFSIDIPVSMVPQATSQANRDMVSRIELEEDDVPPISGGISSKLESLLQNLYLVVTYVSTGSSGTDKQYTEFHRVYYKPGERMNQPSSTNKAMIWFSKGLCGRYQWIQYV